MLGMVGDPLDDYVRPSKVVPEKILTRILFSDIRREAHQEMFTNTGTAQMALVILPIEETMTRE